MTDLSSLLAQREYLERCDDRKSYNYLVRFLLLHVPRAQINRQHYRRDRIAVVQYSRYSSANCVVLLVVD